VNKAAGTIVELAKQLKDENVQTNETVKDIYDLAEIIDQKRSLTSDIVRACATRRIPFTP
jgi:hypothetical protein